MLGKSENRFRISAREIRERENRERENRERENRERENRERRSVLSSRLRFSHPT